MSTHLFVNVEWNGIKLEVEGNYYPPVQNTYRGEECFEIDRIRMQDADVTDLLECAYDNMGVPVTYLIERKAIKAVKDANDRRMEP